MSVPPNSRKPRTTPIQDEPDRNTQSKIGTSFFRDGFQQQGGVRGFRSYFDHLDLEVNALCSGHNPRKHQAANLAIVSHEDVITVVEELCKSSQENRKTIRTNLHQGFSGKRDVGINRAIDIAIRWWLMINVREADFEDLYPRRPFTEWEDATTLADFVKGIFPGAKWSLTARESRLNPFFTAANMVTICGLVIKWTPYLDDHLRLDRQSGEHPVLWVFSFKSCLNAFLWKRSATNSGDV
jgi:hypothetical protein